MYEESKIVIMDTDPLQFLPEEKWSQLELSLKLDWPRSILVINLLETLKQMPSVRSKFDFKVYCPYGDTSLGVVTTCMKKSHYEVIMHCNREVKIFSEAIKRSKIINWDIVTVQFTDRHVMDSVANTMKSRNVEWCHLLSCDTIYLNRDIFDIKMPPDLTLGLLSMKHLTLVNSTWEHRYPESEWYFEQLINSKLGYGLFETDSQKLIGWVFYTEYGNYDNMHILDTYRRRGYGDLLVKIAYNMVRKNKDHVYSFCEKGNSVALAMYQKVGIKIIGETFWAVFKTKERCKI